jgi:uncharacterized protein DUF4410
MKKRFIVSGKLFFVVLFSLGVMVDAYPQQSANKKLAGYEIISLEKVTVEKSKETEDFPEEYGAVLHQSTLSRLKKKNIFNQVTDAAATSVEPLDKEARRLILSSAVIQYKKGSRAKRYFVGFGAGATKVKVRFTFRDAATGQELLRTERDGSYSGVLSLAGGGKAEANEEAVGDVLDGLIKDILKNR